MNIELSTSNIERITGKNEETEIRSGRETFRIFRKRKNNSTLDVRLFARSKLDVESSTLDVHLFTRSKLDVESSALDVRLFIRSKLNVGRSTLDVHLFTRSKLNVDVISFTLRPCDLLTFD